MKRAIVSLLLSFLSLALPAQSWQRGELKAIITDEHGEAMPFVNVVLKNHGALVTGGQSDFDGLIHIAPISPDTYDIELSSLGYGTKMISGVVIQANRVTRLDPAQTVLHASAQTLACMEIVNYSHPLFSRTPVELAATAGGTYAHDASRSAKLNIRGSRADANYYYIDGIKVRGAANSGTMLSNHVSHRNAGGYIDANDIQPGNTSALHPIFPLSGWKGLSLFKPKGMNAHHAFEMEEPEVVSHVFDLLKENYEFYAENEFKSSRYDDLSTFAIDVDNASYTNARRIINDGYLPPLASVRLEEFLNYFPYQPVDRNDEHPFVVDAELGDCPWNKEHQLLMLTVQADSVVDTAKVPSNLVFLLDVSGSMHGHDRLGLVKRSFQLLTAQLGDEDRISIVVYSGASGVIVEGIPGSKRNLIQDALERLEAGGSTGGSRGIELAYRLAEKYFIKGGNNRVILATDGDFNVGITSDDALVRLIEKQRETGVFLTTIGVGMGNYKDGKLEKLANNGNGNYFYMDSYTEAKKVFQKELVGNMYVVAKDVKIQVEFNPQVIQRYRLLGYENRVMAQQDFDNDLKDGGELGSGQMVVACYELVPVDSVAADTSKRRYVKSTLVANHNDELFLLKMRYKQPDGKKSTLIERPVAMRAKPLLQCSNNFLFASSVIEFGLLLRDSKYKEHSSFQTAMARAEATLDFDPDGYRNEFIGLIQMSAEMYASAK